MSQPNEEVTPEKSLDNKSIFYLMSVAAGLLVANIYYNQPLLHEISVDFGIAEADVSRVALATQIGYALGLLFIVPLGDKIACHKILRVDFVFLMIGLIGAAMSNSLGVLVGASLIIGFTSSLPQLFVPMAARLSSEKYRGQAIGIVMSGLLIGIIGSRVLSGFLAEHFGWRAIFVAAAGVNALLFVALMIKLPRLAPGYKGSYLSLMKSIGSYFKADGELRLAALRGALSFAGLSAFWTTLVFLMEHHFGYGSGVTGLFGFLGLLGALAAAFVGKLNDRMSSHRIIICAISISIISWVIFLVSGYFIAGLVVAVILVDLGQQGLHITNQKIIFSKHPEARNRVNTVYMVTFFLGGGFGTLGGAIAWQHFGWTGVSLFGLGLSLATMAAHLLFSKTRS